MVNFFQPTSKVQKDRRIMRETDARMAKYSRRGLVFNFVAFLICLIGGRFFEEYRVFTIVLTTGLLVLTLLRGFYIFRFDNLYPRAPAKWRNGYFVVTLMGAMWWGTILVSIISTLGFHNETPLLMLYTVVFFSTTAHAFAPYQTFLSYYQFFGIIPAAAAALWLADWNAFVYGILLGIYYLILTHQCRLISENYWEKLEATYALSQRALSVEQEKRESHASLQLSKEFLADLNSGVDTIAHDYGMLSQSQINARHQQSLLDLQKNISDFKRIIYKEIDIASKVFNVRHELQFLVGQSVADAEVRGIQIETSLSSTLPMRLKGDATRFAQIVKALLAQFIQKSEDCSVIVEVQFLREYERAGELYVTLYRIPNKQKTRMYEASNDLESDRNLTLSVAKALADAMTGSIERLDSHRGDLEYRFIAKLDIADLGGQLDFHKGRFSGKRILLVNCNPAVVDIKRQELDALGFSVATETQIHRAQEKLEQGIRQGNPIENVLFYVHDNQEVNDAFITAINDSDELRYINKLLATTPAQQAFYLDKGIDDSRGFYFVNKPLGLFELESAFDSIFAEDLALQARAAKPQAKQKNSVIFAAEKAYDRVIEGEFQQLPGNVKYVNTLEDLAAAVVEASTIVIPCYHGVDITAAVNAVRDVEQQDSYGFEFVPIIGVGNGCDESDICAFEAGFDDFIDIKSRANKTLASALVFWGSLSQDEG